MSMDNGAGKQSGGGAGEVMDLEFSSGCGGLEGDEGLEEEEENLGVFVVVMGVSGTGKSTLGIALAERLRLPYIEGDELHPKANVDKMSSGVPLTDEDRRPWLELIRERAERRCLDWDFGCGQETRKEEESGGGGGCNGSSESVAETASVCDASGRGERGGGYRRGVVATCSALKKSYRDILRGKQHIQKKLSPIHKSNANLESNPSPPPLQPPIQTYFVWINGSKEILQSRIETRQGHFFKASMLDSQLKTLESPEDEEGVAVVPLEADTREQVRIAVEGLRKLIIK